MNVDMTITTEVVVVMSSATRHRCKINGMNIDRVCTYTGTGPGLSAVLSLQEIRQGHSLTNETAEQKAKGAHLVRTNEGEREEVSDVTYYIDTPRERTLRGFLIPKRHAA